MPTAVNDITITPAPLATFSGLAFGVPEANGIFGLGLASVSGFVSFLGYQNTPSGRPSSGQLWPRGETLP